MDAWRLEGPRLSVVVTRIGAQIVAIQAPGTDLNPLWQPPWPSDPSIPNGLLDVICGSNVCLDRFGPTRDDETRPAHGEAGLRSWEQILEPEVLCVTTTLPQAQLGIERRYELRGDVLIIATKVENLSGKTLSFEWAEHPTIGDPFLDGARFTAGVDLATTFPEIEDVRSRFQVPPLSPVDPTLALAMPPASHKEAFGDIVSCRVREGFWKAENPRLGYSLECRWDEAEFLRRTEGSAIRRIGWRRWRRNLAVALGNAWRALGDPALAQALQAARPQADPQVQRHIDWALAQRESA
jgi:hypothetical protein